MPFSNDDCEAIALGSARAVAYHAGYDGAPATDTSLDEKAQKCAELIMANRCPMWVTTNAGFAIRNKRHKSMNPVKA